MGASTDGVGVRTGGAGASTGGAGVRTGGVGARTGGVGVRTGGAGARTGGAGVGAGTGGDARTGGAVWATTGEIGASTGGLGVVTSGAGAIAGGAGEPDPPSAAPRGAHPSRAHPSLPRRRTESPTAPARPALRRARSRASALHPDSPRRQRSRRRGAKTSAGAGAKTSAGAGAKTSAAPESARRWALRRSAPAPAGPRTRSGVRGLRRLAGLVRRRRRFRRRDRRRRVVERNGSWRRDVGQLGDRRRERGRRIRKRERKRRGGFRQIGDGGRRCDLLRLALRRPRGLHLPRCFEARGGSSSAAARPAPAPAREVLPTSRPRADPRPRLRRGVPGGEGRERRAGVGHDRYEITRQAGRPAQTGLQFSWRACTLHPLPPL